MVKKRMITRLAWTQKGVNEFEAIVNEHMSRGWEPITIEVSKEGFRIVCFALMAMPVHCDCDCACCTGQAQHDEDCKCACDCCLIHSDQCVKEPTED